MNLIDQTIDSRKVAEMIDVRHDNLLQKINQYRKFMNKDAALKSKVGEYFIESEYFDSNNQLRKCFKVTKKGCDMIANKLVGEKGVQFTANYIEIFSSMQQELLTPQKSTKIQLKALLEHEEKLEQLETDISELKQEIDLSRLQKKQLSDLVRSNVMEAVGGKKSAAYSLYRVAISEHWRSIKNYFNVASYEEIPKLRFSEAMELAECWTPSAELAMEIKHAKEQLQIA